MNRSMEYPQILVGTDKDIRQETSESGCICLSDTLTQLKAGIYDLVSLVGVLTLFIAAWVVL